MPTCKGEGVLWGPKDPSLEQRVAALEKVAHPQAVLADPELTEALKRYNEDRKRFKPTGLMELLNPLPSAGDALTVRCWSGRPWMFC